MTVASTIPTFKAAFGDRLAANQTLGGVQILYGIPPTQVGIEAVILGNSRSVNEGQDTRDAGHTRWIGGGTSPCIEERYALDGVVSVAAPWRSSQRDCTNRAFEIMAAIETDLLAWQFEATQYDGVVKYAAIGSVSHIEGASEASEADGETPRHRVCRVLFSVNVQATLQA